MAAIYMWFVEDGVLYTTPPYPIEVVDQLAMSARVTSGSTFGVENDALQFSGIPLNSSLDLILIATPPSNDSRLQFSGVPLDSTLDTILLSTFPDEDSLQFSSLCLDSSLDIGLVSHTNPFESLDWSAVVTGGSHT